MFHFENRKLLWFLSEKLLNLRSDNTFLVHTFRFVQSFASSSPNHKSFIFTFSSSKRSWSNRQGQRGWLAGVAAQVWPLLRQCPFRSNFVRQIRHSNFLLHRHFRTCRRDTSTNRILANFWLFRWFPAPFFSNKWRKSRRVKFRLRRWNRLQRSGLVRGWERSQEIRRLRKIPEMIARVTRRKFILLRNLDNLSLPSSWTRTN